MPNNTATVWRVAVLSGDGLIGNTATTRGVAVLSVLATDRLREGGDNDTATTRRVAVLRSWLPPLLEEGPQQLARLAFGDAAIDLGLMVAGRLAEDARAVLDAAALGIGGAVIDAAAAGRRKSPGRTSGRARA